MRIASRQYLRCANMDMVDQAKRRQLSQHLRCLVTGRMTNDEFDRWYFDEYHDAQDRAIREVSTFGYSLYSSDLLWPYRLRGIHAVNRETRRVAARCVLFLRSNLEYEWPHQPDASLANELKGAALFLGLPLGIAVLVCSLSFASTRDYGEALAIALAGVGLAVLSVWLSLFWSPCGAEWERWRKSGDFEVWPFRRTTDFDRASRPPKESLH